MVSRWALIALAIVALTGMVQCGEPCKGTYCGNGKTCAPVVQRCKKRVCPSTWKCVPGRKLYCSVWGDPHFDTFDGAEIHFMGVGWYIMAERSPNCGHLKDFILLIEHEHRDGNMAFSWIKSIQLDVGTVNVNIDKLLIIRVNNKLYNKGDLLPAGIAYIDTNDGAVITNSGVVVTFDGIGVAKIWTPPSYANCMLGLCGNANGNAGDDFYNKYRKNCARLPWNKRYWCVGNSWAYGKHSGKMRTVDLKRKQCGVKQNAKFNGVQYCGSLQNMRGPFGKCISKKRAEAKRMHFGCIYDVCANQDHAKTLACAAVELFADSCGYLARKYWKKQTGCLCRGDLVWTTCGRRDCTLTCHKPYKKCSHKCTAMCACPRTRPFRRGNTCLSQNTCKKYRLWLR